MMNVACDSVALPPRLATNYQVRTFTDAVTNKPYCLLMEVLDADGPLGCLMVWWTKVGARLLSTPAQRAAI
jgi:hypothetical protein